jgi:hypothetical protein
MGIVGAVVVVGDRVEERMRGLGVVLGVIEAVVGTVGDRLEERVRLGVEESSELGVVVGTVVEATVEGELTTDAFSATNLGGSVGTRRRGKDGPLVATLTIEEEVCGGRVDVVNVDTEAELLE